MRPNEILKSRREQRRISLETVQKETRISLSYLEAMESGRWEIFPAEVYLLGFLRKYASYLGLNAEEVVGLYRKQVEESRAIEFSRKESQRQLKKREDLRQRMQIFFLGFLLVALGAWWIFTVLQRPSEKENKAISSLKAKLSGFSMLQEEILNLKLEATENSWLYISDGNKILYEGFFPRGAVRNWSGKKSFLIRVTNPSSLSATLNNLPLDLKKMKNQKNEIFIDWQTVEMLTDTALKHAPASRGTAPIPESISPLPTE